MPVSAENGYHGQNTTTNWWSGNKAPNIPMSATMAPEAPKLGIVLPVATFKIQKLDLWENFCWPKVRFS